MVASPHHPLCDKARIATKDG